LTIFGEKIGVFLKNQCYDQNFAYFIFVLSKNTNFFAEFFGENILKIITSVPGLHEQQKRFYFFASASFFCRKSSKITEISDHNIGPPGLPRPEGRVASERWAVARAAATAAALNSLDNL
jgi:hypothetical protein